jgi:hypothetical protein
MELYKNFGRDSGVYAYEIAPESITVQFKDGKTYLYTFASAGAVNIAEMHLLAMAGQGLNSYISRVVKKSWAQKW